jgi:hypothetical protein
LARDAAAIFADQRTQMHNLEQAALRARTLGDLLNFIKGQAGRDGDIGDDWRSRDFAKRLHDMLWDELRGQAETHAERIFNALEKPIKEALETDGYEEKDLKRRLRLAYARAYVRHLTAEYMYRL